MPMRAALNKFIAIFKIELQDLKDDISDLLGVLEKRRDSGEITNYVYLGNKGVLLNEIDGIEELLDRIAKIDAYQYASLEEMMDEVRRMIESRIQECAFPEVCRSLVGRKFDKVCRYIAPPAPTDGDQSGN